MLSVSTATVHRAIRPKTPESSPSPPSLGRKERQSWNCKYTVYSKRHCRQSAARKQIIPSAREDATIGIDVHCQTVRFDQSTLESTHSEQADEAVPNSTEGTDREIPSQGFERISKQPLVESLQTDKKPRPCNPIPFVKSSQMQRNKFLRTWEENIENTEESIEKIEESIEKTEESINKIENSSKTEETLDNDESAKFKETESSKEIVELESKFEDDDTESIFDVVRSETPDISGDRKADEKNDNLKCSQRTNTPPSVLSDRMTRAKDLLKEPATSVYQSTEEFSNDGIPGIPGDTAKTDANYYLPAMRENGWDSDVEMSMTPNLREDNTALGDQERLNNRHFVDEVETNDSLPYYMTGFPNPLGENRCWLNATLHAMFALPLIDHLESLGPEALRSFSELTKTFMALRLFWSKGRDLKQRTYQTIKTLKESLGILDESYPSQRQQDVSEFLTMFLNYLKTDFEKLASRKGVSTIELANNSEETENIPENIQGNRKVPRSPQTPTKRPPLADISPRKRKFAETGSESGGDYSPKARKITYSSQDLLSPRVNRLSKPTDPSYKVHTPPHHSGSGINRSKEIIDFCKNPIDRYFLLHMMEHYRCETCSKHRQRKVDNLMLYVDLPAGSENHTVSLHEAVNKSLEPEDRDLTCSKCKHEKHKVYTTFRACPRILMVQVNRYGICDDGSVGKFNTPVEIPETLELDLGALDAENGNGVKETFEPVCVIAHVGSAMDCGHYTSYVRHDDNWYHYNDLSVTPMSRFEALAAAQTTAYVVFFVSSKL